MEAKGVGKRNKAGGGGGSVDRSVRDGEGDLEGLKKPGNSVNKSIGLTV